MKVRAVRSFIVNEGSFCPGQILTCEDPAPEHVVDWLNRGLVEVVREPTVERAVGVPGKRKRRPKVERADAMG